MANYQYRSPKGRTGGVHGKSNATRNVIITLVALLLAMALVLALSIGSLGFTIQNPKQWFKKKKPNTSEPTPVYGAMDGEGNFMEVGKVYPLPAALTFFSASTGDEADFSSWVTVTAEHNFEYNNVQVDWLVLDEAGADASEYVEVITNEESGNTAILNFKQHFTTPLTLKAYDRYRPAATVSCQLDCITEIDYVDEIVFEGDEDFTKRREDENYRRDFDFEFELLQGTVDPTLILSEGYLKVTESFENVFNEFVTFPVDFILYTFNTPITLEFEGSYAVTPIMQFDYADFIYGFEDFDEEHKQAIYYAWYNASAACKTRNYSQLSGDFTIDICYGGKVYDTEIIIDEDNITFGYFSCAYMGEELEPNFTLNNVVLG